MSPTCELTSRSETPAQGLGVERLHLVGAPADIDLDHSGQQRSRLSGHLAREDRGVICANSELRLVVVAHDEEVVLRRRQPPDQPQLRRVDVLELIHEDVREAALPAIAEARILVEQTGGADDEIIEVQPAARGKERRPRPNRH